MNAAASPNMKSRIAGLLYLACIGSGFFAELVVRGRLVVLDDAAATAHNIAASQDLFRLGFLADFAALTCGIVIAVILYGLLKPVNRTLALLDLVLAVVSNVVSLVALVHLYAPLILLNGAAYWSGLPPAQLAALALFSLKLYETAYAVNLMLFGFECLTLAYLIYRSNFLPRFLGVLLAVAGVCYVTNSFVDFMPPNFADFLFPYILLPSLVAETALASWLLVFGVNADRWERVRAAARHATAQLPNAG
jgi:hypothetical protein